MIGFGGLVRVWGWATLACCASLVVPTGALATSRVFTSTGEEQSFTVPAGVTSLYVVAVGAPGGAGDGTSHAAGGVGAVVRADLAVTPGELLYLEVGGAGADSSGGTAAGGFNGGGAGGVACGICAGGGGGGGASDVRTVSVSQNSISSLESRLLVAAGGGGGGGEGGLAGGAGGAAGQPGSPNPSSCTVNNPCGGGAGTATAGGSGGASNTVSCGFDGSSGVLGAGGAGGGGSTGQCSGGGGGGGGLYGGGGGGGGAAGAQGTGGGGGGSSGFGSGATNTSIGASPTTTPSITITYLPALTVTKGGAGKGVVTSSPAGISCGTTCTHAFQAGAVVKLTAKPSFGSKFTGWSGACKGTAACNVRMNSNSRVTASFTKIPPPNTTITGKQISPASHRATFDFNGSSGAGTLRFQCKLDTGSWKSCTTPKTYTGLSRGSHVFEVRAIDARGTADPTPAQKIFKI